MSQKKLLGSTKELALSSVHGLAFHRGLGEPLYPSSSTPLSKYLDASTIEAYASAAYSKPNIAIVANGADNAELSKWVGEFFKSVPSAAAADVPALESSQSKYYGGEERIAHASSNTVVLGFAGSSSYTGAFYKPEIAVLASLLGGESSIKWSSGFSLLSKAAAQFPGATVSTKSQTYSDAGILYVQIHGSAKDVAGAAFKAVETIKAVASGQITKEDITKAKAQAKFQELELGQNVYYGIEATGAGLIHGNKAHQIDETAKLIDSVDEAKLKKVSFVKHFSSRLGTDVVAGCEDITREQGICFICWRSICTAIRRGAGFECVNTKKDLGPRRGVVPLPSKIETSPCRKRNTAVLFSS
jgi:ubiquinol-cytochrome c reductase core subunit 2